MPGYKAHLVVGVLSFAFTLYVTNLFLPISPILTVICFSTTLVGALFPDLDVTSKIQRIFYILLGCALVGAIIIKHWLFFISGGILAVIIALLKHRTILHNPAFLIVISLIAGIVFANYQPTHVRPTFLVTLFFIIGALSHIGIDSIISKFFKRH